MFQFAQEFLVISGTTPYFLDLGAKTILQSLEKKQGGF